MERITLHAWLNIFAALSTHLPGIFTVSSISIGNSLKTSADAVPATRYVVPTSFENDAFMYAVARRSKPQVACVSFDG